MPPPTPRGTLAFDTSYAKTGVAAFLDRTLLVSGVVEPKGDDETARLFSLSHLVLPFFRLPEWSPRGVRLTVLIETPAGFAYNRSVKTAADAARRPTGGLPVGAPLNAAAVRKNLLAVGTLFGIAASYTGDVHLVSPQQWKGRRKKWVDQLAALEDVAPGKRVRVDEADALGLARWWLGPGGRIAAAITTGGR
jgi:hypothetical protein